jgi:hypothetical protein
MYTYVCMVPSKNFVLEQDCVEKPVVNYLRNAGA